MTTRCSRLRSAAAGLVAALGLVLAAGPADASVDCPCWDALPANAFLFCYDPGGVVTSNSFGYAAPNVLLPFQAAFYQVTNQYCRINGSFVWLHSADEADDCRRHLWESCFPTLKPPC